MAKKKKLIDEMADNKPEKSIEELQAELDALDSPEVTPEEVADKVNAEAAAESEDSPEVTPEEVAEFTASREFNVGDKVEIISLDATKKVYGFDERHMTGIGSNFEISAISHLSVLNEKGFQYHIKDLKLIK